MCECPSFFPHIGRQAMVSDSADMWYKEFTLSNLTRSSEVFTWTALVARTQKYPEPTHLSAHSSNFR